MYNSIAESYEETCERKSNFKKQLPTAADIEKLATFHKTHHVKIQELVNRLKVSKVL